MKKLLTILIALLILPLSAGATAISWDFANSILQPLQSAWSAQIKGSYFTATSTTNTSTFPRYSATHGTTTNATSTNLHVASKISIGTTTGAYPLTVYSAGENNTYFQSLLYPRLWFDAGDESVGVVFNRASGDEGKAWYWGESADTGTYNFRGSGDTLFQGNIQIGNTLSAPDALNLIGGNGYMGYGGSNQNNYPHEFTGSVSTDGSFNGSGAGLTNVPASAITAGTFGAGNYSFSNKVTIPYASTTALSIANWLGFSSSTIPTPPAGQVNVGTLDNGFGDLILVMKTSDGSQTTLGGSGGGGCTTLPCDTDVDDALAYTAGQYFRANGSVFTNSSLLASDLSGQVGPTSGGTGLSGAPSFGQMLVGNASSGYTLTATSSLGLPTHNGTNAFTGTNSFTGAVTFANATGTNLALTNVTSSVLKTNSSGSIIPAVAGTDYESPLTFSGLLSRTGNTVSLPLNQNITWTGIHTFSQLPQSSVLATSANDLVNYQTLSNFVQGIGTTVNADYATTSPITKANLYNGNIVIDDHTVATNDRIGLFGQASASENGIWVVQTAPNAPIRASNYDSQAEADRGSLVSVLGGTNLINSLWVQTTDDPTIDSSSLVFARLPATTIYTASKGLQLVGSDFQTRLLTSGGLYTSGTTGSEGLGVLHDNSTLSTSTGALAVKDLGITAAKLAAGAVDLGGSKITGLTGLGNGGTATTTFWNTGIVYSDGSKLTQDTAFTWNATADRLTAPYASTTALTVSGTNGLAVGTLTGPLQAISGLVSATSTISSLFGGTGQTSYTDGQLLIGKSNGSLAKATLTAGSNITITNGDGTITIASTGGSGGGGGGGSTPTSIATSTQQITDLSIANSTTFQDTDLKFTVGANEVWSFRAVLQGNINGTADFKGLVTAPLDSVCIISAVSFDTTSAISPSTSQIGCSSNITLLYGSGNHQAKILIDGTVRTAGTAGTVKIQVAPNSSTANSFTIYSGSQLQAFSTTTQSGLTMAGSDTQVLYNDGGVIGADSGFTFNETTDALTISGSGTGLTVGNGTTGTIAIGDSSFTKASGSNFAFNSGLTPSSDDARVLGTTALRWSSLRVGTGVSSFAGNVGIGTTTPAQTFAVTNSSFLQGLFASSASCAGFSLWPNIGDKWELQACPSDEAPNNSLFFYNRTDSAFRLTIDGDGKVGINDNSPDSLFDLDMLSNVSTGIKIGTASALDMTTETVLLDIGGSYDTDSANLYGIKSAPVGTTVSLGAPNENFAFWGNPTGGGTDWGMYMTGEDKNYFSGIMSVSTTTATAGFNVGGSELVKVRKVTTTATLTTGVDGDNVVLCDHASVGFTVNLPTAVGNTGLKFQVKNINSATCTLDGNGSQTIDGNTTSGIGQNQFLEVISDGANWWIISQISFI